MFFLFEIEKEIAKNDSQNTYFPDLIYKYMYCK